MSQHSHSHTETPNPHCDSKNNEHSCCNSPVSNVGQQPDHQNHSPHSDSNCCAAQAGEKVPFFSQKVYFYISLILTIPFFISMIAGHHNWFNIYIQCILATPVFFIGILFFGLSAWRSVVSGRMNMNVLIMFGSSISYFFSLYHVFFKNVHVMIYFETSSSIITLVLLGNFIEEWTIRKTNAEVKKLIKTQDVKANMLVYNPDGSEHIFQVDSKDLKVGDLILIKSGEIVPADAKILWGTGAFDESIISGESLPVHRQISDFIIGASMLTDGNIKAQISTVGKNTVLNHIIDLITNAQAIKPKIQKLADKISAIFVPTVLGVAVLCFIVNYFLIDDLTESVLRSITVLIIACPCAMGLATPAAIAVGLSRGTKLGILYKDADCLEQMKKIKQVVFDKTGTLTTGNFEIEAFYFDPKFSNKINQDLVYSILKHSNHPVALSVTKTWKTNSVLFFDDITELKGLGMRARKDQDLYEIGSKKICDNTNLKIVEPHSLYIFYNKNWVGWINLKDTIRPEAFNVIKILKSQGCEPIILSGDKHSIVKEVAEALNINVFYAEKSPEEKLQIINTLKKYKFTLMIGDGINDAPALAQADIGASLANASSITLNTAQIILTGKGITELPKAIRLGEETYNTIRSNLFWAFLYNIVTIPIAAMGLLGQFAPTLGAIIMAGSDVVLFLNSAYLYKKNLD